MELVHPALYRPRPLCMLCCVSFVCRFCAPTWWFAGDSVEHMNMYGLCIEYASNVYGICMSVLGTRMEYVRVCMKYVWHTHSAHMEYGRNLNGQCIEYEWNINGICSE